MPGNGPWKGKSNANLQKAIEDAWEVAKGDVPSGSTLVVDEISFIGENPITEYSVKIKKP